MHIISITKPDMLSIQIEESEGYYSLYQYYPRNRHWIKTHPYIDCLVPVDIQVELDKLLEEYYAGTK